MTRWQREEDGQVVSDKETGKQVEWAWFDIQVAVARTGRSSTIVKMQVLEFVAIQRRDTGAWAIPGGMVDPGEKVGGTILSRSCLKPTNVINIFYDL